MKNLRGISSPLDMMLEVIRKMGKFAYNFILGQNANFVYTKLGDILLGEIAKYLN